MQRAVHIFLGATLCAAALALAAVAVSPAVAWAAAPEEEALLRSYLRLGEGYERQGLLKEAEAAYQKVLESESPETRGEALAALERVAAKRSSERFLYDPLRSAWASGLTAIATAILTLALVLLFIWILRPLVAAYGRREGAGKLGITPTTDATDSKLGSAFEEILRITHANQSTIVKHRPGLWPAGATLPMLARSMAADLGNLVESAVPGGFGKVIAWLMRKMLQPEYLISSLMQSSGPQVAAIATVSRLGEAVEEWSFDCDATSLFQEETGLAIEMMEFLTT